MSAELLLVASYPKSGNTWTRVLLEHLIGGGQDVSINDLSGAFHGRGRRTVFDAYWPASSSDLTFEEIEDALPEVFRALAAESKGKLIVKIHECSHRNRRGEWLFPPEYVQAAICLVRHPFDVAVSYANHMGRSIDATIDVMSHGADPALRQPTEMALPLPHWVGSWSDNVESWIDRSPYPSVLARYEDLHAATELQVARLAAAVGIPANDELIGKIVGATKFERLQHEEKEKGFRERPETSATFFRAGRPKSWEGTLDDKARARIVRDHGAMMQRLGYLEDGSILPAPVEFR